LSRPVAAGMPLPRKTSICALVSGGLDSCVMVAELARRYRRVYPIFIRQGLIWETTELRHLRRFLRATPINHQPLTILSLPVTDLYRNHWSTTGRKTPGAKSHDAAVYLPGRNLMLLSKAAVFCALRGIPAIALGTLAGNPFPDATPRFFRDFGRLAGVRVITPLRQLSKTQVIRRGRALPLELSFSCIAPQHGRHCGRCNKCAERQHGFVAAGLPDPTRYAG
jgi:7-cyano-7-deazaguanine synthase